MDDICSICHEDNPDLKLPCNHSYHKDCIRPWFIEKHSCPLCRAEYTDTERDRIMGIINSRKTKKKLFSFGMLKKDIEWLNKSLKETKLLKVSKPKPKKKTKFGDFSDISFRGKSIKPEKGRNGFFYNLPLYGPFQHGDLHFSIFDQSGFAKGHITFKPNGKFTEPAYHYGYKYPDSTYESYWSSGPEIQGVRSEMEYLYKEVIKEIYVFRINSEGQLLRTPYKFNPKGTASTRNDLTSAQKQFARIEYLKQGVMPKEYPNLKPRFKIEKKSKRRLSEFFNR